VGEETNVAESDKAHVEAETTGRSAERAEAAPPDAEVVRGDSDEATSGRPRSRALARQVWGASPAGLLVGVLLALLGFALVVQLQSNTGSGLASRRQDDLVRILGDLSSREERLRHQLDYLQAAHNRLTAGGDSSKVALEEARQRAADLGILAGTLPAQGPGIRLTVTDPKAMFTADNMLDTIEELRGAGAEAIQVGPVRIGLSSAFTQDTPTSPIMVDGNAISQPYVIVAIGDPETLATAMNIPGGVVDTVHARDAEPQVVQLRRVEIRALRVVRPPQYAQPVPSAGH
jgi:uncharacterized protein YlxW (UPF0749 family)